MVATDFEFNGIKLTDVNWRIVSFGNNDNNEVAGGGEVTFNTSKELLLFPGIQFTQRMVLKHPI